MLLYRPRLLRALRGALSLPLAVSRLPASGACFAQALSEVLSHLLALLLALGGGLGWRASLR